MTEAALQASLLLSAPTEVPELRLFRRNIGAARMRGGQVVKFASAGQCDLYGIVRGGRHLEIEIKAAGGRLSVEQVMWQQWCSTWGVPHVVLRAERGETVEETVTRWCGQIRDLVSPPLFKLIDPQP